VDEILQVATKRCLSAANASEGNSASSQLEAILLSDPEPRATSTDTKLLRSIELLATWAQRELHHETVGPVIASLSAGAPLPPDIAAAWASVTSKRLRELANPELGNMAISTLFDELLLRLGPREREVYVARLLLARPPTLQVLGGQLGLTRERVRQLQARAERMVTELLTMEEFAPLRWRAFSLRALLGNSVSVTSDAYDAALGEVALGTRGEPQLLLATFLVRLAGYTEQSGRIIRGDAGSINYASLTALADEWGVIDGTRIDEVLDRVGVAAGERSGVLERIGGVRVFGDRVALWKGSVVDKATSALAIRGAPASAEELAEVIGEGYSVRSLRNRLGQDPRIARVGKHQWALRVWGLEEYSGVADEIAEEVERQGGAASMAHLIEVLTLRFGVAEGSVRAYAQTPRFVVEGAVVRLRRSDEPVELSARIGDARGCFQDSPSSVTFCVAVDRDVLRGSGRAVASAVAVFLGVIPGTERTFDACLGVGGDDLSVVVTWPMASAAGPAIGSTRGLATRLGAVDGDLLRLRFDRGSGTVEASRVVANELREAQPLDRLAALTGLQGLQSANVVERLAASLGVERSRLRSQLYRRGDHTLIGLLPVPSVDARLSEALAELGDALAG
jgi:hypothetical protein